MEGSSSGGGVAATCGSVVVVGPLYCAPHAVHLTFTKKAPGVKSGHLAVLDADGRLMFKVEDHESWTIRDRKLLLDVVHQPIVLVQSRRKTSSAVYDVYRGNSWDAKDLLFNIRKVSASEVHVFLAVNTREHFADFKVKGDIKKRTIAVYKGESTQMVAEMSKVQNFPSKPVVDKKAIGVAVSPNVDSCFVAALFVALPKIYDSSDDEDGEDIEGLGVLISTVLGS